MSSKLLSPDEFEKTLTDLDTELDNIQKCSQEIFQKIDNSFFYPYPIGSVSMELNVLLSAIQHFEKKAKISGITSLSTTSTTTKATNATNATNEQPGLKLNIMVEEKKNSVDELKQESSRITDNVKAALP